MSRDRRGFQYSLEPVQVKTEWEINEAVTGLAKLNRLSEERSKHLDLLTFRLARVRADQTKRANEQATFDITSHRTQRAYLAQLQQTVDQQKAALEEVDRQRDGAMVQLAALRRYADGLTRDREACVLEYDLKVSNRQYQMADEGWSQQSFWKKNHGKN